MINIDKWKHKSAELKLSYSSANPYPHVVLDNFLEEGLAYQLFNAFPVSFVDKGWIHWQHFNENKHGLNNLQLIPSPINEFIEYMNSDNFVHFLEDITGISNLISDNGLEGGGLHLSPRGGYLNIHADFSIHPRHKHLQRKINVLLYLNPNWREEYKGALELWSADMKKCEKKIPPLFNRLVIFGTTKTSFHGFPEPLECPHNETRKSIAFYYYNKTQASNPVISTLYQTRPGDGLKAIPNWIDNKMILGYTYLKSNFGISDSLASNLLSLKEWFKKSKKE